MATIKFICEFFFTNFWHWLGGLIYIAAIFGASLIKFNISKKGE